MKASYKVGDSVTLRAQDNSTSQVTIRAISLNESGQPLVEFYVPSLNRCLTLLGEAFARNVTKDAVVESLTVPNGTLWRGQLVQVFKRGTNEKVDMGTVTCLTHRQVEVNGTSYGATEYGFLPIG